MKVLTAFTSIIISKNIDNLSSKSKYSFLPNFLIDLDNVSRLKAQK